MTKGDKLTVYFSFEKETPGAVRYQEVDGRGNIIKINDGAAISTLYVRKSALKGKIPERLTVTVEA